MERVKVAALIPAAGEGLRLGHGPKALVTVAGETLLNRAVKAFAGLVDEVIVAIAPTMQEGSNFSDARFVSGGATRQESVYNLLRATDADFVLIHDAARPFLSRRTIEEVIAAVKVHDAVSRCDDRCRHAHRSENRARHRPAKTSRRADAAMLSP